MADSEVVVVPGSKRRRLRGSCDICKQRKSDSAQMPGGRCSNCVAFNSDTRTGAAGSKTSEATKGRKPKSAKEHVADIVIQATAYIPDTEVRHVLLDVARYARDLENRLPQQHQPSPAPSLSSTSTSTDTAPASPETHTPHIKQEDEDDFDVNGILTERFDRFRLESDAQRYFGKSSHFELINAAIGIQEKCTEMERIETAAPVKRPEYWFSEWEHEYLTMEPAHPALRFPDPDLLQTLITLFFDKFNIVFCLLHRPTFERSVAAGLHLSNYHFACTVLAVCAVAARYSDDPRVIFPGTGNTKLSSGWSYYRQLPVLKKPLTRACTLYEAQTICLAVFYIQGSSSPDGCWTLGGTGLRWAQEVGAHRRTRFEDKVEAEHWKRVFWVLLCIDTLTSTFCGRPRAISSSDYDVDLPIDCDDEYWEADEPFKQPSGKPSSASFAIAYFKLIEILGTAQRTIYQENPKEKERGGGEWMQGAIANLDSALNEWIDQIPAHLRWDPHMSDPVFVTQSAMLYASYYHIQIQIHRIFLSKSPERGTPPCNGYASLAICANSARACSHVMDTTNKRGFLFPPYILSAVFDASLVILLSVWGGRYVGITVDPQKCLEDVGMCLRVFKVYETRWQIAGRQHDIITEFLSAANMNMPYTSNPLKRRRELDPVPELEQSSSSHSSPSSNSQATPPDSSDLDPSFFNLTLPMHTQDLGRLPMYEPFNFNADSMPTLSVYHPPYPDEEIALPLDIQNIMAPGYDEANGTSPALNVGKDVWDDWGKYLMNVEDIMHSFGSGNNSVG
ncbi:fungal-specific transcription factor domain-containing protein [Roridomyces roridus]|uniref:Fungal-specific transcription factor domain-containing protein n=1 Tax=Roridomyces roridus TaxID=1738132 RepID=A0AAD7CCV8_9AGAR|nr:fungal-specific transcription factor domain-containing protein [Roridomyces roridus]